MKVIFCGCLSSSFLVGMCSLLCSRGPRALEITLSTCERTLRSRDTRRLGRRLRRRYRCIVRPSLACACFTRTTGGGSFGHRRLRGTFGGVRRDSPVFTSLFTSLSLCSGELNANSRGRDSAITDLVGMVSATSLLGSSTRVLKGTCRTVVN